MAAFILFYEQDICTKTRLKEKGAQFPAVEIHVMTRKSGTQKHKIRVRSDERN